MPRSALPGYVWDERLGGRYRRLNANGSLGALVSRDTLVAGLREIAKRSETALGDLAMAVANNQLTVVDAQLAGQYLLKDLYNAYAALARGGWDRMDAAAWGRTGRILGLGTKDYPVGEYASWRAFMTEIAQGNLSEANIRARAKLYAGKAYARYWQEDRLLKLAAGQFNEERWYDAKDERECGDCPALAALGWVPIGTFRTWPGAGATECLGNCRCAIAYRVVQN